MTQTGESFINEQSNKPELQSQQIANKLSNNATKIRMQDIAENRLQRQTLKKWKALPKRVEQEQQTTPLTAINPKEWITYQKQDNLSTGQELYEPIVALKKNIAWTAFEVKQAARSDNTLNEDLTAAKEKLESKYIESKEYIDTSSDSFNKIRNLVAQDENVKWTLKTVENKLNDIVNWITSLSRIKDFPTKWKDSNWDMVMTNGKSTITLPVLQVKDYTKDLETAYNTVTYAAATDGVVLTPEYLKENFDTFKDQSDDVINLFINECMYDVQQNEKRPLDKYINFFPTLSFSEWYKNKNDSLLDVLTDSNIIDNALWYYMYWKGTEWRTSEEWKKFVEAANIIQAAANTFNNEWYNESLAWDYIVAKTYGKQYPIIQEAIKTYENFNITNEEILEISNMYSSNISDMKEFVNEIWWASPDELQHIIRKEAQNMIDQFRQERIQEHVRKAYEEWKEMSFSERQQFGTVYQKNGKRYKWWEEITEEQAEEEKTFTQSIIDWVWKMSNLLDENAFDSEAFMNRPTVEAASKVLFDDINTAFQWMMYFSPGWLWFQLSTQIPVYGDAMMYLMDKTIEWWESLATRLADEIWFAEWWSDDTIGKYEQSVWWLFWMLFMKVYHRQLKKFEQSALAKAIKAASAEYAKWIKDSLISPKEIQENIRKTNQWDVELDKTLDKTTDVVTDKSTKTFEIATESPESTVKTPMFSRNMWDRFKQTFNETFQKELNKWLQQEWWKPGVVDRLYMKAKELYSDLQEKRRESIREQNKNISEKQKEVTTEQTEQRVAAEIETPEVKQTEQTLETVENVEQAKQWITEKVEWWINNQIQNIKSAIKWIYNIIRDFNENRTKLKQEKQMKKDREKTEKQLRDFWLTEEEIRIVMENPYWETLLQIVDSMTEEVKEKWETTEVRQKERKNNDEVQREVLSEWFKNIQEHLDRIKEERSKIWKMYEQLSKIDNIDTRGFAQSEALTELLDSFDIEIKSKYNFDTKKMEYTVQRKGWLEPDIRQEAIINYTSKMLDLIWQRKISEDTAQSLRTKFKYKEETAGDLVGAFEKSFRAAFNQYLDTQPGAKLLREIDKSYSEAYESLEVFKDLTNKKNDIKDAAKNKILKMSDAEIDMIDELVPGTKEIVELTKNAPKLVEKLMQAKLKTRETRHRLADPVRYAFVGLPSVAWFIAWWVPGVIAWSFLFKYSEMAWNWLKSKIVWKEVDWSIYNKLVDNLKISDAEKSEYKRTLKKNIEKLRKEKRDKSKQETQEILREINEILIDREAPKIEMKREIENKKQEAKETKESKEVKGTPEEVKETTPETKEEVKEQPQESVERVESVESVDDFVESMNETAPKEETKKPKVDLEKLPDSLLNELRDDPNCPEEIRWKIEDILSKRIQNNIARETERWQTTSEFWVKDEVEFVRRAHQLQEMEKNLGKVWRNKVSKEVKSKQEKEFLDKKEAFIEEIAQTYWIDQHEAYNKYKEFENRWVEDEQYTETVAEKTNQYSKENKKEIKEMKEEWKKDMEDKIIEASAGKEEWKEYSKEAKEIADSITEIADTMENIETDYAIEKLQEEWKTATPENVEAKKEEIKESETTWDEVLDQIMWKTEEQKQQKQEVLNEIVNKKQTQKTKVEEVSATQNEQALKSPEKPKKATKEKTKKQEYKSEKTSTYEWKWKENIEKFEEKFWDDANLFEEDEYGENVWVSKEAKLHNHINQTFKSVDRSPSVVADGWYDEQLTKATEVYNTNLSYKDINLKYFKDQKNLLAEKWAPEDVKALFDRNNVEISIWDPKLKYTPMHELTHALDYKFAKELWFEWNRPLSDIVSEEWFKTDNPLIERFMNILKDIDMEIDPVESFAEFWEKFEKRVEWKKTKDMPKDTTLFNRFADWLSDMADAREKWELKEWTLKETEWVDPNYFRLNYKVTEVDWAKDPQLKKDINYLMNTYKNQVSPNNPISESQLIKRLNEQIQKGIWYDKLTKEQKFIYDVKQRYIEYQVREHWIKIADYWDLAKKQWKKHKWSWWTQIWTTVTLTRTFFPHVVWDLYDRLKADWYIVTPKERMKRMTSQQPQE